MHRLSPAELRELHEHLQALRKATSLHIDERIMLDKLEAYEKQLGRTLAEEAAMREN
jgi:hypothetical protein